MILISDILKKTGGTSNRGRQQQEEIPSRSQSGLPGAGQNLPGEGAPPFPQRALRKEEPTHKKDRVMMGELLEQFNNQR
ncbi:MAG: hypothetical protein JSU90_05785 [Nitrospiraceae bacterium]|nr:MAG: hypothetical protein JSU90_05785 [Nitrospiraceae bacterium]